MLAVLETSAEDSLESSLELLKASCRSEKYFWGALHFYLAVIKYGIVWILVFLVHFSPFPVTEVKHISGNPSIKFLFFITICLVVNEYQGRVGVYQCYQLFLIPKGITGSIAL